MTVPVAIMSVVPMVTVAIMTSSPTHPVGLYVAVAVPVLVVIDGIVKLAAPYFWQSELKLTV